LIFEVDQKSFGIHWFRRDLRIAGNPALQENFKKHLGRVIGIFCFDAKFLSRDDFSHHRFAFFLKTLKALKSEMQAAGGDLLVLDETADQAFPRLIRGLKPGLTSISFNRDYENYARNRDKKLTQIFTQDFHLELITERDHLIIEPFELTKVSGDKNFYQVYSPFAKKWLELFNTPEFKSRIGPQKNGLSYLENLKSQNTKIDLFNLKWTNILKKPKEFKDSLEHFEKENQKQVRIEIPEGGSLPAFVRLEQFANHLTKYDETRNFPELDGTSKFSFFLKNGSLTTAQVLAYLKIKDLDFYSDKGETKFLKELIWREFYYHIIYHTPRAETESFNPKYVGIKWQNNENFFKAWCEGKTGYPIVDAGMRQLNTTGWMHNRVRMIVASFLTKDLLIDWRWGENYFMKMLIDGDIAPNNGGWQWAASTGCDPQPYFRIFNPLLQSQKFDPTGAYIRKYIPELTKLDAKKIHSPSLELNGANGYPKPIVVHAEQKPKALALYLAANS
jgi:deoxyribodipyrimidine photo-lyase